MIKNKLEAMEFIVENDVKFIRLQFCDIFGTLKNVSITSTQIDQAFSDGIGFNELSVKGFETDNAGHNELLLFPDIATMNVLPCFFCDIKRHDGTIFESSSRNILKETMKRAKKKGFQIDISPKCQFTLFKTNTDGSILLETHDNAGYFDIAPLDKGENVRREICLTAEDMGLEIQYSHHSNDPGQHEIAFKYDNGLTSADNLITFKTIVKTIAQRNGLFASFMPKPMNDTDGNGLKINMTVTYNKEKLFVKKDGLSAASESFMAGILSHLNSITLVGKFDTISVNAFLEQLELGSPDPSCNPYLLYAALIEAGMEGVEQNLTLDEMDLNPSLPISLTRAIDYALADTLLQSTIGEKAFSEYVNEKKVEFESYNKSVHKWEMDRYLKNL